ncbi:MAG: hypothetical protein GY941_23690 [Planctomycetes bacterium]|nr:hypothetical protein [Planctomycetota bacterium]
MGKGTIISGGDNGLYQVQINYNRTRYDAQIARYVTLRASLVTASAAEPDSHKKALIDLQILSVDKASAYLTAAMPDDNTVAAWCADLTEDLSGSVGTIEVPGELVSLIIQPGYDGNAVYDEARDGQVMPTISQTSEGAYYNLAMLPGWQKWMPISRYGTIDSITNDVADVTLETTTSSQQSLVINQEPTLYDVDIEYLDCNGAAFEVGDEVLVLFTGQDWESPKIVGFKDNPQPCGGPYILIEAYWIRDDHYPHYSAPTKWKDISKVFVWDLGNNAYAVISDGAGGTVDFPADLAGPVSTFLGEFINTGGPLLTVESTGPSVPAAPSISLGCTTYPTCPHDDWTCSDSDSTVGSSVSYNGGSYYRSRSESRDVEENCDGIDYYFNSVDLAEFDFYNLGNVLELRNNSEFTAGYLQPNPGNTYGEVGTVARDQDRTITDVGTPTTYNRAIRYTIDHDLQLSLGYLNIEKSVSLEGYSNSDTSPASDEIKDNDPYNYKGYGPDVKQSIRGYFSDTTMISWVCSVYNSYNQYSGSVHTPEELILVNDLAFDITIRTGYDDSDPATGYASRTDGATPEIFASNNTAMKVGFTDLRDWAAANIPYALDAYGRELEIYDVHIVFNAEIYE